MLSIGLKTNMSNKIYIASAGSGKTSLLIKQVNEELQTDLHSRQIAIITYTVNNQENIRVRLIHEHHGMPVNVSILGWYKFLLDFWIKPFKGTVLSNLFDHHVGLQKVDGLSDIKHLPDGRTIKIHSKTNDPLEYFTTTKHLIYSDKLSEFAFECYNKNTEDLLSRLGNIFSSIYIDEAQDLSNWDFEILKIIAKNGKPNLIMYGDPRQRTIETSAGTKNKKYNGRPDLYAIEKINQRRHRFIEIDTQTLSKTHRCVEQICAFANKLFPKFVGSHSCSCHKCLSRRQNYPNAKGMFLVKEENELSYIEKYSPVSLIWNSSSQKKVKTKEYYNYGSSKGLQFDATIIYPTSKLINFISREGIDLPDETRTKFYVAVTRARYSCAIVVPDNFDNTFIKVPFWNESLN